VREIQNGSSFGARLRQALDVLADFGERSGAVAATWKIAVVGAGPTTPGITGDSLTAMIVLYATGHRS
jgi:hypothetical protein